MPDKKSDPRLKNIPDKNIAVRLSTLREAEKLTLGKTADKIQPHVKISVGRSVISNLEKQQQNLTIELAIAYSKAFYVSLDYILCLSDDPHPRNKDIRTALGLSDKAIDAIEQINGSPYVKILNTLFETGFIPKLLKAFERFIDRGVIDGGNTIWLDHEEYPQESAIRPNVWYLKNEINDSIEAIIDTVVSEHKDGY